MLCPACLTFGQTVDAVTTVQGTVYCAGHGVQALEIAMTPGGPRRSTVFRPVPPPASP